MLKQLFVMVGLVAVLAVTGCSSSKKEPLIGEVDNLYNKGMSLLEDKKFTDSIHAFEELERQHPYSGWSTRAQIMVAFAQYRLEQYDESLFTIERFIRLHPGHEDLDYMYYMRGMNHYVRISDINRDQGFTEEASKAFQEVIDRFPNSRYSRDAGLKLTLTIDHIAGKEMEVGRYYQKQKQYLAAINRFKRVVDDYQKTLQIPEALYRLTESYFSLGLDDQARRSAAVLGHNYPDSDWYKHAYKLLTENGYLEESDLGLGGKVSKGFKELF